MQRLAVLDGQLSHARLADGLDAQIEDCLVEPLGQQAVDHFFADSVGKAAPNDRLRHLAGAEAGDFGVFPIVSGHRPIGLGDLFGGNVQHQLAGAVGIQNRPLLVIVPFVIVAHWRLGRFGLGVVFDCAGRTQSFAFHAPRAPNKLPD